MLGSFIYLHTGYRLCLDKDIYIYIAYLFYKHNLKPSDMYKSIGFSSVKPKTLTKWHRSSDFTQSALCAKPSNITIIPGCINRVSLCAVDCPCCRWAFSAAHYLLLILLGRKTQALSRRSVQRGSWESGALWERGAQGALIGTDSAHRVMTGICALVSLTAVLKSKCAQAGIRNRGETVECSRAAREKGGGNGRSCRIVSF